jgi:hypothetical protein
MKHARRFAWLVMLIADVGLLAWGAMAALALGLALVWGVLAVTAPFRAPARPVPATR